MLVSFRAAAMGRSTTTSCATTTTTPRTGCRGSSTSDIMRRLDGEYRFEPTSDGTATHVVYELEVDLIIPLPGFVKRRAEHKIMHTALDELRGLRRTLS